MTPGIAAETYKEFHTHSDGLGSGGTVQTVVLYCDSPAERGGQFYYYDLIELFKLLYEYSPKTFSALMMDRAITVTRKRGKGAIRVSSPIIYFADDELPGFFYRKSSGEYLVEYANYKLVQDGIQFIEQYAKPGTTCSLEVPFNQPFTGAILNNRFSAHHRNSFVDGASSRLLSRKWYMRSATHQPYKHIPLVLLSERYYKMYPRYADKKYHNGEWLYNSATDSHQIANLTCA